MIYQCNLSLRANWWWRVSGHANGSKQLRSRTAGMKSTGESTHTGLMVVLCLVFFEFYFHLFSFISLKICRIIKPSCVEHFLRCL